MEEADVLCNRIGIVNHGVLQCLGSQNRLKSLYGGDYHLFVNCFRAQQLADEGIDMSEDEAFQKVEDFLKKLLPDAIQLRMFNGQFVYQVPVTNFNAQKLFNEIESNK